MQIGSFEIREPIPQLNEPHMVVNLRPWTDAGNVGSMTLTALEKAMESQELGRLRRPSIFYDFTRYRPTIQQRENSRHVELPNSVAYYSSRQSGNDLVFLHALEPHASAEDFVESILELTQRMGVRSYCQIGAFYGASPHTRPLRCSGRASDPEVANVLMNMGLKVSGLYQGPTSIMALTVEMLRERGISTLNLSVQLPHYARLDEDYRGQETLMRMLDRLYNLGLDMDEITERANNQYLELDKAVAADPQARAAMQQLEQFYDDEHGSVERGQEPKDLESIKLPPSIEQLLKDLESGKDPKITD